MGEPTCRVCGKTKTEHEGLYHRFTESGGLAKRSGRDTPKEGAPASQIDPHDALTSDPVLRIVMMRKGLITLADIEAVEKELRGKGVVYGDVHPAGAPGTDQEVGSGGSTL